MVAQQEIKSIKVDDLRLWTENPRDPINTELSDYDVIRRAIDENPKDWNLDKLYSEMGNYYDFSEIPTVVYVNDVPVVYDGNRRVALLKYLQNPDLYSKLSGKLYLAQESPQMLSLREIPCNVCDAETALTNIERKHSSNGSWSVLQRDYFLHYHRGYPKSTLLILEEQTKLISTNRKMNQRFVRDEVLTPKNLKDLGISIDNESEKILSVYDEEKTQEILSNIVDAVNDKRITTRGNNRGQLKATIESARPSKPSDIKEFDLESSKEFRPKTEDEDIPQKRRTPISKKPEILFGKTLALKDGQVNDLYRAVDGIFNRFKSDPREMNIVLPIIGMSLRLLLDVAARKYYEETEPEQANDDQLYKKFLSQVKKQFKDQKRKNYLSLTNNWLSDKFNVDGLLAKYAHGNIVSQKNDILDASCVVGDILEEYFGK